MLHTAQLARRIRQIAAGYILLYFHIKINGFDLLPGVVGWLLIWLAIRDETMVRERPNLKLLHGFALVLGLDSLRELLQIQLPGWCGPVVLILSLVGIYFRFQILSELAGMAEHYIPNEVVNWNVARSLCRGRNLITVLHTASILLMMVEMDTDLLTAAVFVLGLVQWVMALLVTIDLFSLAKGLRGAANPEP